MKKILLIIGIIFVTILFVGIGQNVYTNWTLGKEVSNYPDYYRQLAEECTSKVSSGCCMSSVRTMQSGNFKLAPELGCPEGFRKNMLKCIDSNKWCEPGE